MAKKVYFASKTIWEYIAADSEEQAIEFADKMFRNGKGNWDNINISEFSNSAVGKKKLLAILKRFHGSECEKEYLEVKRSYNEDARSVALRKLADFMDKGEYKQYNISLNNFNMSIHSDETLESNRNDKRWWELFMPGETYNIETKMKYLEDDIAEIENAIVAQ